MNKGTSQHSQHHVNTQNSTLTENQGWIRRVVFSGTTVKPVIHVAHAVSPEQITSTVQRIDEGDVVYQTVRTPSEGTTVNSILKAVKYKDQLLLEPLNLVESGLSTTVPVELQEFLNPLDGRVNGTLPIDFGWDGINTITMFRRRADYLCFFAGFNLPSIQLEHILNVLISHPTHQAKIKWSTAVKFPDEVNLIPTPDVDKYWFIINNDGTVRHERITENDTDTRLTFENALRALRLTIKKENDVKYTIITWEQYSSI